MSKTLNLVKYAGDFWVTLAEWTQTRDTDGYSDHASVKSAVRTYVVKQNADKYIAFRGEAQLKNIIQSNKNNDMFDPEDFQGTRTALIHWDMLVLLDERFKIDKKKKAMYSQFIEDAEEVVNAAVVAEPTEGTDSLLDSRELMKKHLRQELTRLDKEIEVRKNNKEKILQAINALESLEVEDVQ